MWKEDGLSTFDFRLPTEPDAAAPAGLRSRIARARRWRARNCVVLVRCFLREVADWGTFLQLAEALTAPPYANAGADIRFKARVVYVVKGTGERHRLFAVDRSVPSTDHVQKPDGV
jgi:hypothetical protein